ncbi:glycoside hydrolase family 13 protein [Alteromonas ponticola]|uniref:Glycoside hydrolase family 13 protein n=1 Tax=Alteromonas aquimaris TaxID=2998417 RepID=A0ABT3PC80_9ALTE|nr:glycoside hydrolase family 13 protein [Alteromonas aquimaris]MCW8109726.1 glycoside hydrolase family 13 protein [Alteromonas aquimaris]
MNSKLKVLTTASVFFMSATLAHAACTQSEQTLPVRDLKLNAEGEFVPHWAKKAIWYQIFPERFRNGDKTNDPTVASIEGADPNEPVAHWQVHPWGSDWYELQAYEKANGDKELWKHMLRRRYGGDLQGIIDKLDYIEEMGFNALYLNPVFHAPSLHKYDSASLHHIDPHFGPDPEGDKALMAQEKPWDPATWVWTKADKLALELIEKAHKKGIKVIFDGVFNHMGINSFAFQDVREKQQASPFADWFTVNSWRNEDKGTEFAYQGWFGVQSLPEFKESKHDLAPGPKEYIFAITERWMNPMNKGREFGIDGWRLDVAFCVGHGFWKDWRQHVKELNDEAYLTAEIVDSPEKVKPYLQGDEFDGEMNYNFAFTAAEFLFNPPQMAITASEFDTKLRDMRELYPKGVAYVTQNLFGSHDSNRIASHIVNRGVGNFRDWGEYFQRSQVGNNPQYSPRKPTADELHLQKLFVILQMTYVGAPMVYYGDEVGMWGANDPDNRKPMIWPDIDYADEKVMPDGSTRKADKVAVNTDLQKHYQTLIDIRKRFPALQTGAFKTLLVNDDKHLYGFERTLQGHKSVRVIFNNSQKSQTIGVADEGKQWTEVLNQADLVQAEGKVKLSLPAKWAAILVSH